MTIDGICYCAECAQFPKGPCSRCGESHCECICNRPWMSEDEEDNYVRLDDDDF